MNLRHTMFLVIATVLVGFVFLWHHEREKRFNLTFAAGDESTPSFEFAKAIKSAVEAHYPRVSVHVFESRGSLHNARLISRGAVDVAITELEQITGADVRFVSQIYPALYHLIAHPSSGIKTIEELKGKSIAVPPKDSVEYQFFVELLRHYEIRLHDVILFSGTHKAATWLFSAGAVDAIFRIRAAGDTATQELLRNTGGNLIEINHAEALRLANSALDAATIPSGAYSGYPSLPLEDLKTAAVRRVLLAHKDANEVAVNALTSVLFEHRRELTERVPLAGNISAPDQSEGISLPLHKGARRYFERDQPNFVQENAEPLALLLSMLVVVASLSVHYSARANRKRMDAFNRQLVRLADKAREAETFEELDRYDSQLGEFFGKIIDSSEQGKVNAQEFALFKFAFQATEDAIRDREFQLRRRAGDDGGDDEGAFRQRNRMTQVT